MMDGMNGMMHGMGGGMGLICLLILLLVVLGVAALVKYPFFQMTSVSHSISREGRESRGRWSPHQ